jgi:hypothetical protein
VLVQYRILILAISRVATLDVYVRLVLQEPSFPSSGLASDEDGNSSIQRVNSAIVIPALSYRLTPELSCERVNEGGGTAARDSSDHSSTSAFVRPSARVAPRPFRMSKCDD